MDAQTLIRAAVVAGSLLFANALSAATGEAQGTVQGLWTYGDGTVLVGGFHFSNASCSNNGGFFIAGTHPNLPRLLAAILAAKAQGTRLAVIAKIDNCWYPEITTDASTYIYTNPSP